MTLKWFPLAVGAWLVATIPAAAQQPTQAESLRAAEQEADRAVADARAEVLAEAQADAAAARGDDNDAALVTISDVREGRRVHDPQGGLVGTIESVNENGAVISTGGVRAQMPFSSFAKNDRGLVIALTRAQLEAEVAARLLS